ncbi:MBL fold metallo-hydrolase [Microbacterium sp. MC2]
MTHAERWTQLVTRILAPNAGPMTLDGTNSLVVRAPGAAALVVDPGPEEEAHLAALQAQGPVELIVLTHHHRDHTEAAARFAEMTGAPVRAFDPHLCIDAPPLDDGEVIDAGGTRVEVLTTPGHTADSVSLFLPEDAGVPGSEAAPASTPRGSMITGDTILGRGTTIIAHPDGSLGRYLASLDRLAGYGDVTVLPAHGDKLPSLAEVCRTYAGHRRMRLDQVRELLAARGLEPSGDAAVVAAVVDDVYGNVDPAIRFAAEASVRAQLEYLAAGPLV